MFQCALLFLSIYQLLTANYSNLNLVRLTFGQTVQKAMNIRLFGIHNRLSCLKEGLVCILSALLKYP